MIGAGVACLGVAAALVLMRHSGDLWGGYPFRNYLAVDLFFLLSGFVLAHAFEARLRDRRLSVSEFMAQRLLRIYPMFAVALVLCAMLVGLAVLLCFERPAIGTPPRIQPGDLPPR